MITDTINWHMVLLIGGLSCVIVGAMIAAFKVGAIVTHDPHLEIFRDARQRFQIRLSEERLKGRKIIKSAREAMQDGGPGADKS